jgi:hypothetical protein
MVSWLRSSALRNSISIVGALVTTFSAVLFLVVFFADLFGLHSNPYIGIVFFLILPGFFLFGLVLIPVGAWLDRKRRLNGAVPHLHWPRFDMNDASQRQAARLGTASEFVQHEAARASPPGRCGTYSMTVVGGAVSGVCKGETGRTMAGDGLAAGAVVGRAAVGVASAG